MAKPETSKKDAILAIGLEKATSEIIAAAAEEGVKVSRTYVDLLKQQSGAAGKSAKKSRSKSAGKRAGKKPVKRRASGRGKKAPAAAPAPRVSKADYVRSFSAETKAGEIVAQGKEAGFDLTTAYVYKVRGSSAGRSRKNAQAPKPLATAAARETQGDPQGAFQAAIVAMVLDAGLPAARARFEDIVAKILTAAGSV